MAKKKIGGVALVGGSSLLVIFAVLCLTIFALLTLATVEAGGRLSQKAAASTEAFYAASAQAEEVLARLRQGEMPEVVQGDGVALSYRIPVIEGQELLVVLGASDLTVWEWRMCATEAWALDDHIAVWDGGTPQVAE